jgi:4-diphosphocytidyl-2-C-methyl-D-erythritol kinase
MSPLILPAPAKLNLFLHITGRRADGYHTLQTVFQLLDYGDTLTFKANNSAQINFTCSDPALEGPNNLVVQAASLLSQKTGSARGADIRLDKRLPLGGGVGGGSSDAATTLLALNSLWQCGLGLDELAQLGLSLGADVPVFVHGRSAWAENVGESLQALDLPERWYIVLTPDCQVSTGEIFSHPQLTRNTYPIKIPAFPFSGSKNDCELLVQRLYPPVKRALDWLSGFTEARMTGTGASVFASFDTKAEAQAVLDQVPQQADKVGTNIGSAFIARGVNFSPLHQALLD